MSSAFVKEGDNEKLNEVGPALYDLLSYLRRENGGTHIYETKVYFDAKQGRDVHEMSDGLTYALNDEQQWYIIL